MTNDQCWRHADVDFLTSPLLLNHLLRLLSNRFQTVDEELGDTGDELHHSTHRHTEEEHLLDVQLGHSTNQGAYNHTQHDRLTQYAEFLLQSLGIDVELREAWNLVEQPVDGDGEGRKTLTERLWDGDAIHIVVVALELLGCEVGHHQCDDVADDGGEVAPCQRLVHDEICHSTNEGEVPVVPEVDVDRAGTFGNEQQEVDAQTDGDDECANGSVVSYSCSCGPAHVEYTELEVVEP